MDDFKNEQLLKVGFYFILYLFICMLNSKFARLDILIDLGVSYVEGFVTLNEKEISNIREIFKKYLYGSISEELCRKILIETVGRDDYLSRINDILNMDDEPIPFDESEDADNSSLRKKTRTWTVTEDQRLLAGVVRFGLENWNTIASFIGNGRSRSQCSQRWARGLNPKISKKSWTYEEDAFLMKQIRIYGEKSWTKIASILKNRTDVQCRYRYKQLSIDNSAFNEVSDIYKTNFSKNLFGKNLQKDLYNSSQIRLPPHLQMIIEQNNNNNNCKKICVPNNLPIEPHLQIPFNYKHDNWGKCGSSTRELEMFLSHFQS